MLTRQQAVEAVERLRTAIQDWEGGDAPTAMHRGKAYKKFTTPVVEVMGEVCGLFLTTDIDRDAWELAMAVDGFRDESNRFFESQKVAEEAVRPNGTDEMWEAFRDVIRKLSASPRKLPGGIRQLQRDGSNAITIAKKYGWYTKDGKPDLQRVSEEDNDPGTHYDPKTFVHPSEAAGVARLQKLWDARCQRLGELLHKEVSAPARVARTPDPRPLEELIRSNPGITDKQIAIRKCCSIDDIHAQLDEMGLFYSAATGLRTTDAVKRALWMNRGAVSDTGPESDDVLSRFNVHDEIGQDLEARMLAMAEDGVKPRNIAKALSKRFPAGVTYQQVTTVLSRLQGAGA
jgi:hypothetical protein